MRVFKLSFYEKCGLLVCFKEELYATEELARERAKSLGLSITETVQDDEEATLEELTVYLEDPT